MKRVQIVGNKPRFFKGKKQAEAESVFELFASQAPCKPLTGPVSIEIVAVWPPTKSDKSTRAKSARFEDGAWVAHTKKPDADNFAKMLIDTLVRLRFINRDEEVSELRVYKRIGDNALIKVTIEELPC